MNQRVKFNEENNELTIAIDLKDLDTERSIIYITIKRVIDILGSVTGIILLLPIFILIAILIKLESRGPIIYKQIRIGKNNNKFYIYKFRSMITSAPNLSTEEFKDASNFITKVGKFIRKTSIDELPQLLNVLKGEMSLVGPRPVIEREFELLKIREDYKINTILPGITGLAQINGRDHVNIEEKIKYDYEYLIKRSLILDINILLKTFFKVIKSEDIR